MKLTRSAFAVMIKFSDLLDEFESLVDEIAMDSPGLGPVDIVKLVKESHQSEMIIKRWESASRMR